MKILIATHYFYPHVGGIENVALNQANGLIKAGHKVTVLTSGTKDQKKLETIMGIRVIRLKSSNLLEQKFGIPYPMLSFEGIARIKNEIKNNEIINIHGHVYETSVITTYFARKLKKPIILTQHSTYVYHQNPLFRILENLADKTLGKHTLSAASKIIAVSQKTKEYIYSIIGKNHTIKVIYNGVDESRFKPIMGKAKIELRKKLAIEGKFVCLCIRRITFKNGISNFLDAAQDLIDNKNITFLLGGSGPDFNAVKNYVKVKKLSNVKLLGYVADNDLVKYYAASDIFILPSNVGEGFPLVVLEAFSSGIPVIATKSGGQVELIKNGVNGFLTDLNKPKQISQKIVYLYKNKKKHRLMSVNCRNIIEKQFSWNVNIQNITQLFKQLA